MPSFFNRIKSQVDRRKFKKNFVWNLEKPVVSFTFDDVPESAFTVAGKILENSNLRGTYYISLGLMNQDSHLGKMYSLKNIEDAFERGHELGCHTYYHLNSFKYKTREIEESIIKNQNEVEKIFPGFKFTNFSYPFGEVTSGVKKIIDIEFLSSRTSYTGINKGQIDLNALKALDLNPESINTEIAQKLFDEAKSNPAWIIFYTHDVQTNCTRYGCEPKFFEELVDLCNKNNLEVLTINETINKFINRSNHN